MNIAGNSFQCLAVVIPMADQDIEKNARTYIHTQLYVT